MKRRNEVLVGVVIVLGVLVLVIGTLWMQGASLAASTTEIRASFREVGQLREGNEVKLRGVAIGRVQTIAVSEDAQSVVVTFRVNSEVSLPGDPVVLLSPENMFGDWQAEVANRAWHPSIDFHQVPDPEILPGYAIPDMSRLTLQAERIANNLGTITDRVETAFTEETAENIRQAIDNIQEVSQTLSDLVDQQATAVLDVTAEVQRAAEEVGDAAAAGRATFERLEQVMDDSDFAGLAEDARATTASLKTVTAELEAVSGGFGETFASADSTIRRIDRLTTRIEAGEGSLGRLLSDSSLVVEAEGVLRELEELLRDFRENPKRYVRLSIF